VSISVLLPFVGAGIGFLVPAVLILESFGGGQDWSGANQSSIGLIILPIGGLFGFAGALLGAIYSYRILRSALVPALRSMFIAEGR
jgi:hypothetical protein